METWKKVVNYMFELNKKGILVTEDLTRIFAKKIFRNKDPGYCELQMPCGAGLNQLAYGPDGSVYTCDEGRMFEEFRIGSVNDGYGQVMKNPTITSMAVASSGFFNSCDFCAFKPFCGICPLEIYRMYGNLGNKDFQNRRCQIHKKMLEFLFTRVSEDTQFENMLRSWVYTDHLPIRT